MLLMEPFLWQLKIRAQRPRGLMRHSSATQDLCLALEIESQERAKRLNICIIDSASQDKESHMRALR